MKTGRLIALGMLCVAACGGSSGDDGDDDAPPGPDATVQPPMADAAVPDAIPAVCDTITGVYGDLGTVTGEIVVSVPDSDFPDERLLSMSLDLDGMSPPDVLLMELWELVGPFEDGYITGSFSLAGDEGDLFKCGACVFIAADYMPGQPIEFHMAQSGTLQIDQLDPTPGTGKVVGSLTNVVMREVAIEGMAQVDVQGGCVSTLEALSFDLTVVAADAPTK